MASNLPPGVEPYMIPGNEAPDMEVRVNVQRLYNGRKVYTPTVAKGDMVVQIWSHSFSSWKAAKEQGERMLDKLERRAATRGL